MTYWQRFGLGLMVLTVGNFLLFKFAEGLGLYMNLIMLNVGYWVFLVSDRKEDK